MGLTYRMRRSALLATFMRMWGGSIHTSAHKQGIEVAFKNPAEKQSVNAVAG